MDGQKVDKVDGPFFLKYFIMEKRVSIIKEKAMYISLIVVVVVMLAGAVSTIMVATKGDKDYSQATKGNLTRLSLIYLALTVILSIGVGLYIVL